MFTLFTRHFRSPAALGVSFVVALSLAACSDSVTGPTRSMIVDHGPVRDLLGGDLTPPPDADVSVFSVSPKGQLRVFGAGHKIYFPARSICDPATSGYGPAYWLQPCTPATQTIFFTVTSWTDAAGRPHAIFGPNVRFVPGHELPTLYFKDGKDAAAQMGVILFCDAAGCVDESIGDPDLATHYDGQGGWVYRAIRHFSGYNVEAF